jgi:hypothetical protein
MVDRRFNEKGEDIPAIEISVTSSFMHVHLLQKRLKPKKHQEIMQRTSIKSKGTPLLETLAI